MMNDIISMKCITKTTECQGDKDVKIANRVIPTWNMRIKLRKTNRGFMPGLQKLILKDRL